MTASEILGFIFLLVIILFLLIGCFVIWSTKPGAFRMYDIPAVYCHRGYHDNGGNPENSINAFLKASKLGLGAELDVHLTSDGKLCVIHDSSLKTVCGTDVNVEETTLKKLSALHILSTHQTVPSLDDVLAACGNIPVLCEIKTPDIYNYEKISDLTYDAIKKYPGQVAVESFNPYVLKWFRENAPEIIRGQLACPYSDYKEMGLRGFEYFLSANLMCNFLSRPDFIAYQFRGNSLGLALNRIYGTRLVAWTVKSMDDVQDAANSGYSSFIGEDFNLTEV